MLTWRSEWYPCAHQYRTPHWDLAASTITFSQQLLLQHNHLGTQSVHLGTCIRLWKSVTAALSSLGLPSQVHVSPVPHYFIRYQALEEKNNPCFLLNLQCHMKPVLWKTRQINKKIRRKSILMQGDHACADSPSFKSFIVFTVHRIKIKIYLAQYENLWLQISIVLDLVWQNAFAPQKFSVWVPSPLSIPGESQQQTAGKTDHSWQIQEETWKDSCVHSSL